MYKTLTLKNGESFTVLFPATKLRFLKAKNLEYYKLLNNFLLQGKSMKDVECEMMFKIIYCSYIVSGSGSLTYDEFINNFPEEYDNLNDVGKIFAAVISNHHKNNNYVNNK